MRKKLKQLDCLNYHITSRHLCFFFISPLSHSNHPQQKKKDNLPSPKQKHSLTKSRSQKPKRQFQTIPKQIGRTSIQSESKDIIVEKQWNAFPPLFPLF